MRGPYQKGAVTNAAIDGRLTAAAVHYAGVASIPRIALFDVAYPADSNELKRLHGYALVVLTAITQDSTELPLRHVYIHDGSATTSLEPTVRLLSRVHDARIGSVFGTFREDVIVLMPVQARKPGAELTVDFAAHRQGFRLAVFDDEVPEVVASYRGMSAPPGAPSRAEVQKLLKREYPDLAASIVAKR